MRLLKMLGLAAFTAVAATALLGVASAAAHTETAICGENVELCPEAKQLPVNSHIHAETTTIEPILLGTINEKCKKSLVLIKLLAQMAHALPAHIVELTFKECTPCKKVVVEGLPYAGTVLMDAGSSDWLLNSTKGKVKFEECSFGVTCQFEVPAGGATLLASNNATGAVAEAKEVELKRIAGSEVLCGNVGKWDAIYQAKGHWLSLVSLP